jgi:DNA-binding CsgD family transcriptional regulator
MGKSALLDYAVESAPDLQVAAVVGVEPEIEFPFAAVHRLLARKLDGMDSLPSPQRDALASAFGLDGGESPNRLLVGLAVLGLISELGREKPLLCVIDDAQYLDQTSGQILAFVARRLEAERVAFLFAVGESEAEYSPFEGLPELRLEGLSDAAAGELLSHAVRGRLDDYVRDRLIRDMHGNPLGLLELPAALTPAQLAGDSVLPRPTPPGERLQRSFVRRIRRLPSETQSLLLLIAAEQRGDWHVLWRAAEKLGLDTDALGPAEAAGLVNAGPPVTFRHTFVRATVYAVAPVTERRRVHTALAAALSRDIDPDRKAWHRAAAAVAPSESLAVELERSAEFAQTRGGYAGAAALLQRAAELTLDRGNRAERSLRAAETHLTAGAVGTASALLAQVAPELTGEFERALAGRLRGAIALARGNGGEAPGILLQSARALEPLDVRLARDTHLEALAAALYAGTLGRPEAALEAARAALAAPSVPESKATGAELLLKGFASLVTEGHQAAGPALRAAIGTIGHQGELRWFGLAYLAAFELWDEGALQALATRHVQLARDSGGLTALPGALTQLGAYEVLVGRLEAAEAYFEEAREISAATGNPGILGATDSGAVFAAAWRGGESQARALAQSCAHDGTARGIGVFVSFAQYALAILELGLSRYEAALTAAQEASADPLVATRALPELVEAAVRSAEPEVASAAVRRLTETAVAAGTEWGLGMLARSRALVAAKSEAEALYREAIDRLQRCRVAPQLARARLAYGEWLRRARRRQDARGQLRPAFQMFVAMGAEAFAARAEAELIATGEHVRPRKAQPEEALTPHELRIAQLVRDGATNREVAVQLFISPRTVEYHLHKVFKKLRITSRTQLTGPLLDRAEPS